jgi:hypothetical protein
MRPVESVVLICWVTETKHTPPAIEHVDHLGKIEQRPGEPVDLVHHDDIDFAGIDSRPLSPIFFRCLGVPDYLPDNRRISSIPHI